MVPQADTIYLTNFMSVLSVILYPKTFFTDTRQLQVSTLIRAHTHNKKKKEE